MYTQNLQSETQNNPYISATSNKVSKVQIPTRVIMNNKTVSIFSGDDYTSNIMTFDMGKTLFKRSSSRKSCFVLVESQVKMAELCPFGIDNSDASAQEWDYDFNLFKYQCAVPRDTVDIAQDELNEKLAQKIVIKFSKIRTTPKKRY